MTIYEVGVEYGPIGNDRKDLLPGIGISYRTGNYLKGSNGTRGSCSHRCL